MAKKEHIISEIIQFILLILTSLVIFYADGPYIAKQLITYAIGIILGIKASDIHFNMRHSIFII